MPQLAQDRPIYLQLKEYIEGQMLSGQIGADEKVPSTNEMAAFFGVNPITAQKAMGLLAEEGLIYKKRGVGMFAAADAQERIRAHYQQLFAGQSVLPMVRRAKSLGFTRAQLQKTIDTVWEEE